MAKPIVIKPVGSPESIMERIAAPLRLIFPMMEVSVELSEADRNAMLSLTYSVYHNTGMSMQCSFFQSFQYDALYKLAQQEQRLEQTTSTISTIIERALRDCLPTV